MELDAQLKQEKEQAKIIFQEIAKLTKLYIQLGQFFVEQKKRGIKYNLENNLQDNAMRLYRMSQRKEKMFSDSRSVLTNFRLLGLLPPPEQKRKKQ